MQIVAPADQFSKAVSFCHSIVAKHLGTTMPMLACVLVEANGDGLQIRGSDLDLGAAVRCDCTVKQQGGIVVPGEVLSAQAKAAASTSETVTLRTTPAMRLVVEAGRMSAKIVGQEPENFQAKAWEESTPLLMMGVAEWRELLTPGVHCHQLRNLQYALDGTELRWDGRWLYAAATDTHRINVATISLPEGDSEKSSREFLPTRFVKQALKLLKDAADDDVGVLGITANLYDFTVGNTRLVTRQLLGKSFPPVDRFLATDPVERIQVNREALEQALQAAKLFADRGSEIAPQAAFEYAEQEVWIKATSATCGEFAVSVPAAGLDCQPFMLTMNPTYLAQALEVMGEAEEITFYRPGEHKPMELRPGDGSSKALRHWISPQHA